MTTKAHLDRLALGILAALLASGALFDKALGQETPKSQPAKNTSVVELLKMRQAVLEQLVRARSEAYQHGEASIEGVAQAQQELVQVKLELATTDDERITVLKDSVERARVFEKFASARYRAARATKADVLRAEAATLKAEFDLLRERQKSENAMDVGADLNGRRGTHKLGAPPTTGGTTGGPMFLLRTAEGFFNKLSKARAELELAAKSEVPPGEYVEAKEKELSLLRAELQAQLRLLKLEVQDAQRDVAVATKYLELFNRAFDAHSIEETKMIAAKAAADAAKSRLHRAETLLALYSKVAESGGATPAPKTSGPREIERAIPAESPLPRSRIDDGGGPRLLPAGHSEAPENVDKSAALRLRYLRGFLLRLQIESKSGRERRDLKFNFKPLLRYNHPTRGILDSCVFRIGTTGRPPAIVTAELYGRLDQPRVLLNHEFIAVNDPDLRLTRDAFVWEPPADAVKFVEFDDAPAPEKHKRLRLTQMQRLADKFRITETWRGAQSDLESFAAPIHRYEPSGQVNADGALFVYGLGKNPEALLFIETEGQKWTWGCAPMGAAKLKATIGKKVVWEFAGGESQKPLRTAAYAWLHLNETFPVDDVDPMP